MRVSRRQIGKLLLGGPVVAAAGAVTGIAGILRARPAAGAETEAAAAAEEAVEPDPTPLARFLAREEADLTREERRRLRRDITSLEQHLKTIRDFPLGNDVPPAGTFRALRSRRGPGRG